MGSMSLIHWVIVLVVVLVVFGPGKLPGLGKSLGEGIRGFKDALDGDGNKKGPGDTKAASSEPAQLPVQSGASREELEAEVARLKAQLAARPAEGEGAGKSGAEKSSS